MKINKLTNLHEGIFMLSSKVKIKNKLNESLGFTATY